jgi:hypothetical protein
VGNEQTDNPEAQEDSHTHGCFAGSWGRPL